MDFDKSDAFDNVAQRLHDLNLINAKNIDKVKFFQTRITSMPNGIKNTRKLATAYQKRLKSYYTSKFTYADNEDIDPYYFEELLWVYGTFAIIKHKDVYMVGSYGVEVFDFNGNPKKITFFPMSQTGTKNRKKFGRNYTVGENAVVIHDDRGTFINATYQFSPSEIVNTHLSRILTIYNEIMKNVMTGRTILKLPANLSKRQKSSIEKKLFGGSNILPTGDTITGDVSNAASYKLESADIKDRTKELWHNYYAEYDSMKESLGASSNSMPDKRERQGEMEINMNNVLSDGINQSKLKARERGMKMIKETFGIDISVSLREKDEKERKEKAFASQNQNQNNV